MRRNLHTLLAVLVVFPLLFPGVPGADEVPEIVVVSHAECCPDTAWPKLEARIVQELRLSGLAVRIVDSAVEASTPQQLDAAIDAQRVDGGLAVSVRPGVGTTVILKIKTPDNRQSVERTLDMKTGMSTESVELSAIKAQEAVWALWYEIGYGTSPPPPRQPPVKSTPPPPAPRRHESDESSPYKRIGLRLDWGIGWSPGGLGPMGIGAAGVMLRLRAVTLGASAAYTALSKTLETDTASASFRLLMGRIFAGYMPKSFGIWQPMFGLRLGAGLVWSRGKSDELTVTTARTVLTYVGGFAQMGIRLSPRVTLPISFGIGVLPPGVDIRFSKKSIATLRILMIEGSVGGAIRF